MNISIVSIILSIYVLFVVDWRCQIVYSVVAEW